MDEDALQHKVDLLPERPGVYLFKDASGRILYVGKAASLRDRVRSYFRGGRHLTAKVLRLVREIADLDHIVTDTEVEALILECNLIKRHRPPYNIRLRDDKNYPYLRVSVGETWPRLTVTRSAKNDGARYFGPYTESATVHETLRTLRRAFPFRTCSDARMRQHRDRACLHYFIGRCPGPCAGHAAPEAYRETIRQLVQFLEGRRGDLLEALRREMEAAAERLEFERAAQLRDRLRALERVVERQKIVSDRLGDHDVVALARSAPAADAGAAGAADGGEEACVQVFFVREGKVVGREAFLLAETAGAADGEVLGAFLKQYYDGAAFIPREILLGGEVEDAAAIEAWLAERRGGRVSLTVPRRGEKRRLVELVERNAVHFLAEERLRRERAAAAAGGALADLQAALGLPGRPERIECYDISNLQGHQAVASMVVFEGGRPAKKEYRKFRIRTVPGPDDYAMMREALARRFRRAVDAGVSGAEGGAAGGGGDGAPGGFGRLPDLVLIDGGRGQLGAAVAVLKAAGLEAIPAFGLAKENEWLFAPGRPDPIVLDRRSPALQLLQRLRDEAHRFAVGYHRQVRGKESLKSILEEIPGIGPKRRKALLTRFGSLDALRRATVEEVAAVPGMTRALAEEVLEKLG